VNASLITLLTGYPGLSGPTGIAVSGSDLFVANQTSGTIGEYTTSGATMNASLITRLTLPTGVAVSGSDLFVADLFSGTIGEYTTSGATVNASLITGLPSPDAIAPSGSDLFVADINGIEEYTTSGATVKASLIGGTATAYGIAIVPTPEPSTAILLAAGLGSLSAVHRKRPA
jgi:hypothetical protein